MIQFGALPGEGQSSSMKGQMPKWSKLAQIRVLPASLEEQMVKSR
jgi:hypothetical protein